MQSTKTKNIWRSLNHYNQVQMHSHEHLEELKPHNTTFNFENLVNVNFLVRKSYKARKALRMHQPYRKGTIELMQVIRRLRMKKMFLFICSPTMSKFIYNTCSKVHSSTHLSRSEEPTWSWVRHQSRKIP